MATIEKKVIRSGDKYVSKYILYAKNSDSNLYLDKEYTQSLWEDYLGPYEGDSLNTEYLSKLTEVVKHLYEVGVVIKLENSSYLTPTLFYATDICVALAAPNINLSSNTVTGEVWFAGTID